MLFVLYFFWDKMKLKKNIFPKLWFTLLELLVSITILSFIVFIISFFLINISKTVETSTWESIIYEDLSNFLIDNYNFHYLSWMIITNSWKFPVLLKYNSWWNWILFWVFSDNPNWYNFSLSNNDSIYNKKYLGYFFLNQSSLNSVLSSPTSIYNLKFNNWKVFKNIILKDFTINYISWVYDFNLSVIKNFKDDNLWTSLKNIISDDILKLNINL